MRFHHKRLAGGAGGRRWLRRLLLGLSIVLLAGGVYLLVLVLTPNVPVLFPVEPINAKELPAPQGDKVYIPKIGVTVDLLNGGPETLEKGAWHRYPERGDPVNGGNFIISAHRFSLGATPGQTRQRSPFYHVDKLAVGDQILVDFQGKRYGYEITEKKSVKPNQVEIEDTLKEGESPKLTLYTCTFKGENDGREVFIAKPLGEVNQHGQVARPAENS